MKKHKKCILISLCVLLSLLLVCFISFPILKSNVAVIETENFSITADMMSYLVKCELDSYVDYHKLSVGDNYLQTVSLNPDEDLRGQDSVYGATWFDYFYASALDKAKTILASCEAAKKENVFLSKEEEKKIEAAVSGINIDTYGIGEDNLKKILTYTEISNKYKKHIISKFDDADYEQFYKNNQNNYDCIDYKRVVVGVDTDSEKSSGKSLEELTLIASRKAEKLLKDIRKKGFDKPVSEYLYEINSDEKIEDLTFVSQRYIESTNFTDWAFDSERKPGDAIIFPGKLQFSIYYLVKTARPYDYSLSEGKIVLGKYDSTNPTLLTELKGKLETEVKNDDDFDKFSTKNGFSNIGLNEFYKDDLPEVVCDWMYKDNRKSGDMDVCTYGNNVYIMRYMGKGQSYFKSKVKSDCDDYEYTKINKKLIKESNIEISEFFKFLILR